MNGGEFIFAWDGGDKQPALLGGVGCVVFLFFVKKSFLAPARRKKAGIKKSGNPPNPQNPHSPFPIYF